MSVTGKELAALLGLSESAVSLALNNRPGVSRATRKRVFDAAAEHGYDFARREVSRSAFRGRICFVVYKKNGAVVDDTPFFSALTDGVSLGCRKEHYDYAARSLYEDGEIESQVNELRLLHFSALIVLATEMSEENLKLFDGFSVPVVFLDASFERPEYSYVSINNIQGAYMATSYLIRKRRSQPGYLRSAFAISNFDQRADGFYKAIRTAGYSASKSVVHRLTPSQEGAYADMKELLAGWEKPASCYFADNDLIAIGAIQAFREAGYSVPGDIGIIGFDDIPACEYTVPPLSTVSVPKLYMGQVAVDRVIRMLDRDVPLPVATEVFTRLVKRKSV